MRLGTLEEFIELREDLIGTRIADPAAFAKLRDPLIARHGSSSTSNGLISARLRCPMRAAQSSSTAK
jgi:hypothetical protein